MKPFFWARLTPSGNALGATCRQRKNGPITNPANAKMDNAKGTVAK